MNRATFASAMEKLGEQANEEQLREMQRQRRHKIFSRIRSVLGFLVVAGLFAYGWMNREHLQDVAYDKFFAKPEAKVPEGTGKTLLQVQAVAEKRDKILDEITK